MVTSAEIYVLILTLGSLFTVPQCLSVPVHSMGRCPTMNCTGDMYMHALLEQDQLEHMQFTPFNAAASPSTGTSARNSAGSRLLAAPLSSPPPFSFEMTMEEVEGGLGNLSTCPARGERGRTQRAVMDFFAPHVPHDCVHARLGHLTVCTAPGMKKLLLMQPHVPPRRLVLRQPLEPEHG